MTTVDPSATLPSDALTDGAEVPPLASAPARAVASRRTALVALGLAVAALGGGTWYAAVRGHESTDDAQVDAEIVAVPARVGGTIKHLSFVDNQEVKAGELLAQLDDDAPRARLAQAEAALAAARAAADAADADARVASSNATGNRAAAEASLVTASAGAVSASDQIAEAEAALRAADAQQRQARADRDRVARLAADGAVSPSSLEQADTALALATSNADAARARLSTLRSNVRQAGSRVAEAQARAAQSSDVASLIAQANARAASAHAQVETARAARDLAALDLAYTRIVAPHDGVVSKRTINEGQSVAPGQTVVQLVTPGLWVTANFKETQLERMRVGQPVRLKVDAFPSRPLRGEIESFSGATGSKFTLLPPDNASGNFTKIVQRVPVRVRVTSAPGDAALRPGMSVDVDVDTRG